VIRKSEFVARTQLLYFRKEILSVISSSPLCNDDNNIDEGKRSFSLLKRILHYARCTMTESRLNDLSLMAHY